MNSADDLVDEEQGFLSHLIELRDRLVKMVAVVGALFCVLFIWREPIYLTFANPLISQLGQSGNLQTIDPAGAFFAPLKLVLMLSVFLAIPFLLYQVWAFVAPGLYRHEKRLVFPLLMSSTALFYLGVAFAYFVVFPLVFSFFVNVAPAGVEVNTDISRYLDFAITLFFAFGIAFEVPVATVILVLVGVTSPEQLRSIRPYVFVGAFIVGMFLTPPDFISQTLLAIPMWLLYEVGIVFSGMLKVRVAEAGAARDARDGVDDDASVSETNTDNSTAAASSSAVNKLALDRKPDTATGGYSNSLTEAPDEKPDSEDDSPKPEDLGP